MGFQILGDPSVRPDMEVFGLGDIDWRRSQYWGSLNNAQPGFCYWNVNNILSDLGPSYCPECHGLFMIVGWVVTSPQMQEPAAHAWVCWHNEDGSLFARLDPTYYRFRGFRFPVRYFPVLALTLGEVRRIANRSMIFPTRPEKYRGGPERYEEAREYLEQVRGMQPGWFEVGGELDYREANDRLTREDLARIQKMVRQGKTAAEINKVMGCEVMTG